MQGKTSDSQLELFTSGYLRYQQQRKMSKRRIKRHLDGFRQPSGQLVHEKPAFIYSHWMHQDGESLYKRLYSCRNRSGILAYVPVEVPRAVTLAHSPEKTGKQVRRYRETYRYITTATSGCFNEYTSTYCEVCQGKADQTRSQGGRRKSSLEEGMVDKAPPFMIAPPARWRRKERTFLRRLKNPREGERQESSAVLVKISIQRRRNHSLRKLRKSGEREKENTVLLFSSTLPTWV